MKTLIHCCFTIALLFVLASCSGGKGDHVPNPCSQYLPGEYLTFTYYNQRGTNPVIRKTLDNSQHITNETPYATINANDALITIPGIRIRTADRNFEIDSIKVEETVSTSDNPNCFTHSSEFDNSSSSFKTDILSVLVLDMSTSLSRVINDLKTYAKEYAQTVVNSSPNSKVAVVFFSSRSAIQTTRFFDSTTIGELDDIITNFTNYQNRTALYEATKVGINLLEGESFGGEKSLVVFTDGGDNDSNNPSQLKSEIQRSKIENRFAIGLKGADFRQEDLEAVGSSTFIANDDSSLRDVFKIVGRGVISVYTIQYKRSTQSLSPGEQIKLRFSMTTKAIE